MIVNPGKFEAIMIDKKWQPTNPTEIILDGKHTKSDDSVTLPGIKIDSRLNFDKNISKL